MLKCVNFVQSDDHVPENPDTTYKYLSTQEKTEYPPGPPPRVVPEYSMPNTVQNQPQSQLKKQGAKQDTG
jgi:hypothetical protein